MYEHFVFECRYQCEERRERGERMVRDKGMSLSLSMKRFEAFAIVPGVT